MSLKDLEALGRTYHGGAQSTHTLQFPPGVDGVARASVDREGLQTVTVQSPKGVRIEHGVLLYQPDAAETSGEICDGVARAVNEHLATLTPEESWSLRVKVLPSKPAYFSVTYTWPKHGRARRRSKLAAPGTRRKRGGGHKRGTS